MTFYIVGVVGKMPVVQIEQKAETNDLVAGSA
jgi:hypothetical protein